MALFHTFSTIQNVLSLKDVYAVFATIMHYMVHNSISWSPHSFLSKNAKWALLLMPRNI